MTAFTCVRRLLLLTTLAMAPASAYAQSVVAPGVPSQPAAPRLRVGAGGLFGRPGGLFGETIGMTGGIGFEFAYRWPDTPVWLGFDGELWQHSTAPPAVNGTAAGHMLVRLQRPAGKSRPYLDVLVGIHHIATYPQGSEEPIYATRAFGVGAGLGITRTLSISHGIAYDVRARYLHASEAVFVSADGVALKGRTMMVALYAGFAVDY
jgi:hypothetical protein